MNEKMKKPLEESLRLFLTNEELRFLEIKNWDDGYGEQVPQR